jgi:hypothetical protein
MSTATSHTRLLRASPVVPATASTVHGPDIGRDSILVGAGTTVILNDRVSAYLYYDSEFARTNYLFNNVTGGVRISF